MDEKTQLAFYVATDGDDAWSGTLPAPNQAGTDGPFRTVVRARDTVRALKRDGQLCQPVTVWLRGGTYYQDETLLFGPQDGGTEQAPITYACYPGETPVISGGREIEAEWHPARDGIWACTIDEVRAGEWAFRVLAVNGVRQQRARLPDEGLYEIEEALSETSFRYREGDVEPYRDLEQVEVVVLHSWNESRFRIAALDPEARVLSFVDPGARQGIGWTGSGGPNRYYVEGALEGLRQPGEWCLDRREGKLYYRPSKELDAWPQGATVVAPVLQQLVRIEGNALDGTGEGAWTEYLVFRGLTFSDTDWSLSEQGYPDCGDVGDIVEPSAIVFQAARYCTFADCVVRNTGTYALELNGYGNRVCGNELYDLGGGGILTRNYHMEHNICCYNHIHGCGLVYPSAVGINVDEGGGTISHNLIHDITHSGVYTRHWATATQPRERRNQEQGLVIEFNEIHHVMTTLNDGAGIFVRDANILIHNNLIHDVLAGGSRCPGWGIYLGCETRDTEVTDNLVYRTLESVHVWYYDRDILIQNNVFVGSKQCQINYQNPEHLSHENVSFLRNVLYCTEPSGHLFSVSGERSLPAESDFNVIFSAIGCVLNDPIIKGLPGVQSFADWRARGLDEHTITADPLFVDLAGDDYTLQPDSPAFKVGFVPIDLSGVGLRGGDATDAYLPE